MFEKWRKPGHTIKEGYFKKTFSYIVFGLICLVFVFLVPMSPQLFGGGAVAYVGSESVSSREFGILQANLREQYKNMLNTADSEKAKKLETQIQQRALQQLITTSLISQAAKKAGFMVSDRELQNEIRSYPYFQRNGRFVYSIYLEALKNQRTNSIQFEKRVRRGKLAEGWRDLFLRAINSNTLDREHEEQKEMYKINFRIAEFSLTDVKPDSLSDLEKFIAEGNKPKINQFFKKQGVRWRSVKDSSPLDSFVFAKTDYDNAEITEALLSHLPKMGLISNLIKSSGKAYIVDLISLNVVPTKQNLKLSSKKEIAPVNFSNYQKSMFVFEAWIDFQKNKIPIKQNIDL